MFKKINSYMRKVCRKVNEDPLILIYHRVAELETDPQLLSVSPLRFEEQIKWLKQHFHIISLQKLVEDLSAGQPYRNSVVITFDDGYADNLYYAKPILDKYAVSATVFITTGHVGQDHEFWWDDLERLLLGGAMLPRRLSLNIDRLTYEWDLGGPSGCQREVNSQERRWNVLDPGDPGVRQSVYREICQKMRILTETQRQRALADLREWAGIETAGRRTHRVLNKDELLQLTREGLIEVGSHTVSHQSLFQLDSSEQRAEIMESKSYLEKILGRTVNSFSYPYGTVNDYTQETTALIREAGFTCACSNFSGLISAETDVYQLPRFLVRNWDTGIFSRLISEWHNG